MLGIFEDMLGRPLLTRSASGPGSAGPSSRTLKTDVSAAEVRGRDRVAAPLRVADLLPAPLRLKSDEDPSWELSWSEDFEGPSLNRSLWNVRANQSHCCPPELELYMPEAVTQHDGYLELRTWRQTRTGSDKAVYNFTSGWVDTKGRFAQERGRFEANCSLPPRNATGVWPAFWLMPDSSQCWPTGGCAAPHPTPPRPPSRCTHNGALSFLAVSTQLPAPQTHVCAGMSLSQRGRYL